MVPGSVMTCLIVPVLSDVWESGPRPEDQSSVNTSDRACPRTEMLTTNGLIADLLANLILGASHFDDESCSRRVFDGDLWYDASCRSRTRFCRNCVVDERVG